MLELKNICKSYNEEKVLKDINIIFRDKEFVSILGPSGSGKTTLLNIIGGLDKSDSGDLLINGKSTKKYKFKDWDTYRNKKIGFVFQNYNLIDHLSVLDNVKLSLTLSGLSKKLIDNKSINVLKNVGLIDHIFKKPNQLSGGQMQRVAIARAIVNNPDIVVADEPTGALDSNTSIGIMNTLKEISKNRLVIMVTHNDELAKKYSTRIINIEDGCIKKDSNVCSNIVTSKEIIKIKRNMRFLTCLKLSFYNLLTKKKRTLLTSFAGSIGIVGIALVLAINKGVNNYIHDFEKESISDYPIEINRNAYDFFEDLSDSLSDKSNNKCEKDKICVNNKNKVYENNLKGFKEYIDSNKDFNKYASNIFYDYDVDINIFNKSNFKLDEDLLNILRPNFNLTLIYGAEPSLYNEVALVVNKRLLSKDLMNYFDLDDKKFYSYEELMSHSLKLIPYGNKNEELKIVGIYDSDTINSSILYTNNLVYYLINNVKSDNKLESYNINNPSSILIYPKDYKSKNKIKDLINKYNDDNKDNKIKYTDMMKSFISGISKILNIVSYILIAFVAISLLVSSIMISIITYISVLERTKEIGILRSIGASKKDIKRVFISETFIEGFLSGFIGIMFAILISNIANIIFYKFVKISNITMLSIIHIILLMFLSIILNVLSGLKPAIIASKKKPVEAFRYN